MLACHGHEATAHLSGVAACCGSANDGQQQFAGSFGSLLGATHQNFADRTEEPAKRCISE